MTADAVITQGLTKKYSAQNGHFAVKDLDLVVPAGRLFGLIGPDGAGKSTTLRMLATVLSPTKGSVSILEHDGHKQPESIRRQIGYMPQNFSLYPDLSVIENLLFFADIYDVPPDVRSAQIDRMLRLTQLEAFKDRRSTNLSGGMKKKLALACSLVHMPRLLLLDEPSTGVDPVCRRELWTTLTHVVQDGVTVVVSTPYMDEAELCHNVMILYEGQALASGSPADLEKELPFDIIEVNARPRKIVRQVVGSAAGVLSWRPVGDRLRLSVPDVKETMPKLERQLKSAGAEIRDLRQANKRMEDVFVHMVEKQRGSV